MTLLIIDIGSSSVRAMLFDHHATALPGTLVKREHSFITHTLGTSTANADYLRHLTESCIDDLLTHPQAKTIDAVGLATFVGNLLGVDAQNQPMTPVYTYADTRSSADVELLSWQLNAEELHQRTGCILHTAYAPALLHHLKHHDAQTFNAVTHWLDFATYLYRHWFGREIPCSYSVASWSGLLNRHTLQWDIPILEALNLSSDKLVHLADVDNLQSGLSSIYGERWPALRDVPFSLAVGDGAAANIGSGATTSEHIALTIGTTAAVRKVDAHFPARVPDGLWHYRVKSDLHLVGGATSEGGNVFHWAKNTLSLPATETIERELLQRQPVSDRLSFLPLLAGERAPGWRADATGIISGLHLSTTSLDILQAALEGVALRLAHIIQRLTTENTVEIMASGGALVQSQAWVQIIANAFNAPLNIIDVAETTGRGTAILTLNALKGTEITNYPPFIRYTVQPNPEYAAIMREALVKQQHVYLYFVEKD